MTYLRLCIENILREYFKESSTSLGNLIKKLIASELYKTSPYSSCPQLINNFLSDSTHSTSSIDYEKETLADDVDHVMNFINDCIYRLYECQETIDKFNQKQTKRNNQILNQKKQK